MSRKTFTDLTLRKGSRAFLKASHVINDDELKARRIARKSGLMRAALHYYDNDGYAGNNELKSLHDLAYNNGEKITIDFVSSETGKQWVDNDGKTPVKVTIDSELARGILHKIAIDRLKSLHEYVYLAVKHGIEQSERELREEHNEGHLR